MTWLSVSDIASARGVSKQAVSKQLARFGDRVPSRKEGIRLMVDAEAYDRIAGGDTDPAQALRNRDVNPRAAQAAKPLAAPAPAAQPKPRDIGSVASQAFSVHRAKREQWDSELSRLALEKELGRLVPVAKVEDAMVTVAGTILRLVESLPSQTEDAGLRVILRKFSADVREALHREMTLLADRARAEEQQEDET